LFKGALGGVEKDDSTEYAITNKGERVLFS